MSTALASANVTAPGTGAAISNKPATDTTAYFALTGTFTGVSLKFEGTLDGTNWEPLLAIRRDTGALVTGTIAATDSTNASWSVICDGLIGVRANVTAIASGTAAFSYQSLTTVSTPLQVSVPGSSAAPSSWRNPKNLIDGGDFGTNPWQRGTSFSSLTNVTTATSLTSGPYTADRWFALGGASSSISVSQQAQTDVPGFADSLRWGSISTTNTARVNLGQIIESADSTHMQGRSVAFSFWAKAGASFSGGTLTVQVISGTGSNQSLSTLYATNAWTGWTGQTNVINTTQAITTTATRYSFTGTVPAGCTQLAVLISYTPGGTSSATDYVDFYGFQLEDGNLASLFEHRDIEVELALCQRYFFAVNEINTAHLPLALGYNNTTNNQTIVMQLPTQMRAQPTVLVSAGGFKISIGGTETAVGTGFAAGAAHTVNYFNVVDNLTGTAGWAAAIVCSNGTGFISVSADL